MGLEPKDATVVQFVLELLRHHRISDASFEALRSQIGDAGIIDVLVITSYYYSLGHLLTGVGGGSSRGDYIGADLLGGQ